MNRLASIAAAVSVVLHGSLASAAQIDQPSPNPERNVYFGDLHLHTSYSFDAYVLMGTRTTPDTAYTFARGGAVDYLGHRAQRRWPLDFLAVTDHAENMGVFNTLEDPNSAVSKSELGQQINKEGTQDRQALFWKLVGLFTSGKPCRVSMPNRSRAAPGRHKSRRPIGITSRVSSPRSSATSGPQCRKVNSTCIAM